MLSGIPRARTRKFFACSGGYALPSGFYKGVMCDGLSQGLHASLSKQMDPNTDTS